MQAFKLYFKVFKRSAFFMTMVYLLIFGLIIMLFAFNQESSDSGFEAPKSRVAVVDNDNSELSMAFASYVSKNSQMVKIENGGQAIKDALFFRDADYIIIIPEGFGENFLKDGAVRPQSYSLPNSIKAVYAERMAESYLKLFNLYLRNGNFSFEQAKKNVEQDLSLKTEASVISTNKGSDAEPLKRTVDYAAYAITCMVILSVSLTMFAINKDDARKRNLASPISASKFGLQVFLGNTLISLICCATVILIVIAIFKGEFLSIYGALYSLNMLVYTIVCLGMSFLIGNLASKNAVNPICNVIALGGSFLGGAFVPQNLLSDTVKNIAVVDPIFWFVKANNEIVSISTFNFKTLSAVFYYMFVQILFAALFFSAAMLVIKYKRTKN